jgi:hypothetical protein
MRSISGIVAVAALGAAVSGCASDPYYARSNAYQSPSYAYSPGYVYAPAPGYASSPSPGYYRNTTYYTYPQQPRQTYDGYWDYQRNYRGAYSSSPEFSSM